jgi:hypothetical protein
MITPGLLQKLMSNKSRNEKAKILRPCEPGWCSMPKGIIFEVMAVIADAAKQKKCEAVDLCVAVHLADDKLQMVRIYDKVPKRLNGWLRVKAAWNVLLRGRI